VFRKFVFESVGEIRRAYDDVDWAATPVGPMASWSPTLRGALDVTMNTRFPVVLLWGPKFVCLYNEAYGEMIADKHPAALGRPAREVFSEAWHTIGPLMESVLAGEGPTWTEDAPVPLHRHGFLQEAYFTFSYSAVRDAEGVVEGVMDIAAETTRQVIDRRRLATLSRLREVLGDLEYLEEILEHALPLLRANAPDLPAVDIDFGDDVSMAADDREVDEGPTGVGRIVRFSLGSGQPASRRPLLVVRLSQHLPPDDAYLGFLRLVASSLGHAVDRINARQAERGVAASERGLSEALQRSLLTEPLQPDDLQVAVRYLPATEQAQVGGDWYDSFIGPDGSLVVAIGDVTGHDRRAVVAMAQVRNLLRGVSYATGVSPAGVLDALDDAMFGLAISLYATAILARVEQGEADAERGLRTLRWSNAGHPPPVLIAPDGRATLLETPADPLLGLGDGERTDNTVTLEPGSSLVLYTDGLVERRSIPLQARLEWLIDTLDGCHELTAEQACDHLLERFNDIGEDDVALLVLRNYPEPGPRPPEAGPRVLPSDLRRNAG